MAFEDAGERRRRPECGKPIRTDGLVRAQSQATGGRTMSDGPTRYYLYIPVWATGRAPARRRVEQLLDAVGSTPRARTRRRPARRACRRATRRPAT